MSHGLHRSFLLRLMLLFLCIMTVIPACVSAETALRGYTQEDGYVYVSLGQYPQTADGQVQPVLWRVLAADDEKCILLSEYILFARCMNASLTAYRDEFKGDFSRTDLCTYLNTVFLQDTFTEDEAAMLLPLEGVGKVFLPSVDDLKNKSYGLGETLVGSENVKKILANPGLRAWGTEWAIRNNGYDPAEYTDLKKKYEGSSRKEMPLKELRLFEYSNGKGKHSPYWTRDASASDGRQARCTKATGGIGRLEVGRDNLGARPMIYLAQGSYTVTSGTGSMDDPCIIVRKGE